MQDLTLMALGTKRGNIQVYESRNLMDNDFKMSTKIVDKKQIKFVQGAKRMNEYDIYFSN